MANRTNIRVGSVVLGGQEPDEGVTRVIDTTAVVGDVVTSDTSTANKVIRGTSGAYPVGVVVTKEKDNLGTVQSFHNVQVVALTGSVILGPAGLQANGDGTAKLVAAGTAGSLLVDVLGSQVASGVTFIAVYRL